MLQRNGIGMQGMMTTIFDDKLSAVHEMELIARSLSLFNEKQLATR